ncbi:multipile epidermal growth factor-like domains protein 8 [Microdochium nivale]|nr:multipile epidermal growth factor-like domains protein 8 [Microdochium nivale]
MSLRYRALALVAGCAAIAQAQTLPYVPTSIFVPEANVVPLQQNVSANLAYVFSPIGSTVGLFTLDFSGTIDASSVSLKPVAATLPFLGGSSTSFAPSLSDNGSLIVYAGDCSSSDRTSVWTLNPAVGSDEPTWTQIKTTTSSRNDAREMGPGFLGSSFSFSTTLEPVMSKASVYVYGGMCPNATSNATSAQSKASYSNKMVRLTPSKLDNGGYGVALVENQGPPVPEAGFTFTGLSASISNRSGTVTQQVSSVLLGGHTQTAFINMSTVAIWSLPEESWTFLTEVGMFGSGTHNTELRTSSATSVDSRSGHTTVLNEAGTALVVLGGWVGDLNQAASPQLAILEIGAGYGGVNEWQWSVPESQPDHTGIYGHGAALLPGNVMMVYGGQKIPAPSGSKHKRQNSGDISAPSFLNLTSMQWTTTYTNPSYSAGGGGGQSNPAATQNQEESKKKLGLGLGLGLGLAAIIAALLVYFWYRRRLQHRRTIRNSALQALSQDQTRYVHDIDGDMIERPNAFAWHSSGGNGAGRRTEKRTLGFESLRGARASMDVGREPWWEEDSPQQIRRKPIADPGRGQYQHAPTNSFDQPQRTHSTRGIHPIIEADEDGSMHDADITNEWVGHAQDGRDYEHSDPFATPTRELPAFSLPPPTRTTRTPSPEHAGPATDPDVQDWMTDIDTADALLSGRMVPRAVVVGHGHGRNSPTRRATVRSNRSIGQYFGGDDDSRTGSNLSESNHSNISGGSGSIRLRPSPGFGVAMTAAAAAVAEGRGDTAGSGGSGSSLSTPSYNTARTSFHALQTEGPSLLKGGTRDPDYDDTPGSPSKSKPRRGWLGSLKRVFSGSATVPSPPGSDRNSPTRDMYAETNDYDARRGGFGEIAAGAILRRKGGRDAWADNSSSAQQRSSSFGGIDYGGYLPARAQDDDEDWDIEKEVEKRLVQVMFTVPKERLRVVNAEPDVDGESASFMDGSDERTGSDGVGPSASGNDSQARPITPILQHPPTPPRTTSPYEKRLPAISTRIQTPDRENTEHRTFSFEGGMDDVVAPRAVEYDSIDHSGDPEFGRAPEETKKEHRRFSFQPSEMLSVPEEAQDRSAVATSQDKGKGKETATRSSDPSEGDRFHALEREISLLGRELESHQRKQQQQQQRPKSAASAGTMWEADNYSDAGIFSAEAVQMERPHARTRVLEMVQSFESLKAEKERGFSGTREPSPMRTSTVPQ